MMTSARKMKITVRRALAEDADYIIAKRRDHFERIGQKYFPALPDTQWWIADTEDGTPVGCMGLLLLPITNEIAGMDLYRADSTYGLAAIRALRDEAYKLAEWMEADLVIQVPASNAKLIRAMDKAGFEPCAIVYRKRRSRNI